MKIILWQVIVVQIMATCVVICVYPYLASGWKWLCSAPKRLFPKRMAVEEETPPVPVKESHVMGVTQTVLSGTSVSAEEEATPLESKPVKEAKNFAIPSDPVPAEVEDGLQLVMADGYDPYESYPADEPLLLVGAFEQLSRSVEEVKQSGVTEENTGQAPDRTNVGGETQLYEFVVAHSEGEKVVAEMMSEYLNTSEKEETESAFDVKEFIQ